MTLNNLLEGDAIDNRDFLDRVDILRTLGRPVLISNFGEFYRLANYLQRHTTKLIGLVMGVPTLREIFEEKYYTDLAGGILESFGRLFKNDLKLYAYPLLETRDRDVSITAGNLRVAREAPAPLRLPDREPAHPADPRLSVTEPADFLPRCHEADARGRPVWEHDVPDSVAALIRGGRLLGYDRHDSRRQWRRESPDVLKNLARQADCLTDARPLLKFDSGLGK